MIAQVDITRALAIDGWMSEQELTWLAEQAIEHRSIVEIGSYLGRSTRALLDHTSGVVYAIDDWRGPRDAYMSKEDRRTLYRRFIDSVAEYYHVGKLKTIVTDHKHIKDFQVSPDMVFIDGSHEYEDVKRDILFWKDKIVPGGLLCGHDANWEDVLKAVVECLGDAEVAEGTTIWWTKV